MFNVGGGEVLVILLVALLVLGPSKLPDAARQIGSALTQIRQMSSGFQKEIKSALEPPDGSASPAGPTGDPGRTEVADPAGPQAGAVGPDEDEVPTASGDDDASDR